MAVNEKLLFDTFLWNGITLVDLFNILIEFYYIYIIIIYIYKYTEEVLSCWDFCLGNFTFESLIDILILVDVALASLLPPKNTGESVTEVLAASEPVQTLPRLSFNNSI